MSAGLAALLVLVVAGQNSAAQSAAPRETFPSTRNSQSELVFENREHDFPQEIGYHPEGDMLLA